MIVLFFLKVHQLSVNNFINEMELTKLEGLGLGELPRFARKGHLPVSEKFVEGFMKKVTINRK